jgi:xanthine dehydrogenase YagT iron-sulfur-binding subunit
MKDPRPKTGMSRRGFLKGVGVGGGVLGSGVLGGTLLPEAEAAVRQSPAAKLYGPAAVPIDLTINGQKKTVSVEPRVTLLEGLRDYLDFTGAKKVCDRATCGACTVILDGSLVYSCSVLAIEARGKSIQTVEGLAGSDGLHPIQAAFIENDAQQCGFCTSGFVMAVKALLDKHPNPTPEETRMAMGGNLCRCGTYAGMHKAVAQASAEMHKTGRQTHLAQRGGINA